MGGNEAMAWIYEAAAEADSQETLGVMSDMLLMGAAHAYRLDIIRAELGALTETGIPFSATASAAQGFLAERKPDL